MFKVSKRYIRRLAPAALALAMIGVLAPASSANAATLTNFSVQPSDPTASAGTGSTMTFTVTGATSTAALQCLLINFDASAGFGTGSAAITPTAVAPGAGGASLFTAGSWTTSGAAAGGSAYKWLSTSNITQATGPNKTFTIATATNPAAGTYYIRVQTFTNTDCATGPLDTATGTVTYTTNTLVSVTVDPTFTFAVATQPTTTVCNGLTYGAGSTVASTNSAVAFGHLASGARAAGVQQLQVTSNAGGGWLVYLRSSSASANVLKGGGTHVIPDSGSVALPSAGTAFFGYTTDANNGSPLITSGNLKSVPTNAGNDIVGYGAAGTGLVNCVGYGVGASSTTAADTYTATMVYTAVPTF